MNEQINTFVLLFAIGVEIMKRATWWKGWTGANLVWMCNIQVQRGLLTGNETAVVQCLDRIYKEIFIGHQQQDGIQADGSFHQHGPELLAGSYGNIFTSQILVYVGYTLGKNFINFLKKILFCLFVHVIKNGLKILEKTLCIQFVKFEKYLY